MASPEGTTTDVQEAARWVLRGLALWSVVLLGVVFLSSVTDVRLLYLGYTLFVASLLPLAWGIWAATRPSADTAAWLSYRRATRIVTLLALGLLVYTPSSLAHNELLPMVAWGALPLLFWASCAQLSHRGSSLYTRIRQLQVAWTLLNTLTVVAVMPFLLSNVAGALTDTIVQLALLTWMLGATALWYIGARVMRAFGDFGLDQHTNLLEYIETGAFRLGESWLAYSRGRGWDMAVDDSGLLIEGTLKRQRPVQVRVWSTIVPVSMEITIHAARLHGLTILAKGNLKAPLRLRDPLLNSHLDVNATEPALISLLDGQHEALMEIFHAHPTACLRDGQLTVQSADASTLVAGHFLDQATALLEVFEARLPRRQHRTAPAHKTGDDARRRAAQGLTAVPLRE